MSLGSEIRGVGMYVPERTVTNDDLSKIMDTSDEWIQKRTGIKERHWVKPGITTSDLALNAANEAIKKSGIKKEDIDLIIFATLSPDHDFPGSGCFLQAKLGLPGVPALDIRQQCTGFLYGLSVADNFIKSGNYKNVLLVGAEVHSTGLDKTSRGRDVSVLFGDGAGAAILSRKEIHDTKKDSGLIAHRLYADGAYAKELWVPGPGSGLAYEGSPERLNREQFEEGLHYPKMNGKKVFTHAIKRMCESLMTVLSESGYSMDDVDVFLFHQANLRINQAVAEQLNIPSEKICNTIERYGNTTAATIPIGMVHAEKAGLLKKGSLVACSAFGSGFTWASTLLRW